jgi:hypothetical protein
MNIYIPLLGGVGANIRFRHQPDEGRDRYVQLKQHIGRSDSKEERMWERNEKEWSPATTVDDGVRAGYCLLGAKD